MRLKSDIRSQAQVLELQRRVAGISYDRLKARYRNRLASPSALLTSLASGLVAGTLLRRPQRRARSSWFKLGRAVISPALLYILRTRATRWLHKVGL